jgi:hypothetical protein
MIKRSGREEVCQGERRRAIYFLGQEDKGRE